MTGSDTRPVVQLDAVSKIYGGVAALDEASFELRPGEIHALVGENGAGKSTLCKLIAGVVSPTTGTILIDGEAAVFGAPKDASRRGISMVYQETSLVPQLTVAQNIVLGREGAFNSVRKVQNAARQVLQRLNFKVEPSQLAGSLSAAKRQMVEIARAVFNEARVIIFDEPTAALTPEETDHLFDLMRSLQRSGVAMIFISHALEEALTYADRISVLRNGRMMVSGPAADFDRARLIRHMIGEELNERSGAPSEVRRPRSALPVLRVENVRMGAMVNNMSFSVFPGEITGIAGLIGSGRSEVAKVIAGHTKRNFDGGRIWLDGREVRYALPSEAVADGIAYVSEDRKLDGFFDTMSVADNIGLGWIAKFGRRQPIAPLGRLKAIAKDWEQRLAIRRLGEHQSVMQLSGGNQQKVVIAKSLVQEPRLVIFDEPTRGVDVGAIAGIRQIIRDIADSGAGVVLISSYLPEILDLSDRILVAKSGTIAAEFSRAEANAERVLQAAIH
ncbi:sugar ABC transporter ATP-binding protein [Aureimonas jatrophae]|uniref:Monosaccharide ABC transporter ATP-binding protein, CUT2 family n=1 Tax=Aureimonas jatrophae TaxID=1166073 RepID=A0A1H0KCZ3_9HYPH|nr:sugar ABC transporter ATP-binding protein [Aureimonas jatrophae]MBB3951066.1 simple sugar transport system ATP-binding protein [Aureimonas jatrophae]SDO53749.1 monosaccharide ABC transporter ATP-binding protein, CUT2 family [Aureimonas jatrophae]